MQFSVEHLGLAARDSVALKNWYVKTLNAEVSFDNGQTPPAYLLRLPGGLMIEIYPATCFRPEITQNLLGGWRHVALRVENIETAKDELVSRGVCFSEPIKPAGGGGRVLFFNDPDGNLIHLVERPADGAFR